MAGLVVIVSGLAVFVVVEHHADQPIVAGPTPSGPGAAFLDNVRLTNYYPSDAAWSYLWTRWDPSTLTSNFQLAHSLGFNAIRLVVPPDTFGWPIPSVLQIDRLHDAVNLAASQGLGVELTLFDEWGRYNEIDGSREWTTDLLRSFHDNRTILFVECQNELPTTNPAALAWASDEIEALRGTIGTIPVTISTTKDPSNIVALKQGLGSVQPDFYSYHFYGAASTAVQVLRQAKADAYPLPLFVGETGLGSSIPGTSMSAGEAEQRNYLSAVEQAATELKLPPAAPWTLLDFVPGGVPADIHLSSGGYAFGLVRANGTLKPSAELFKRLFSHLSS